MKILLIEDDRELSTTLAKLLEVNHYALDLANDGQTGLDLAITVEYDLILLDVQIPKLDGISLCRQLRIQGYGKPILLLMTDDSDASAIAGFEAGADDYINKFCTPEVLLAKMRTLLRRSGALVPKNLTPNSEMALSWGKLCLDWHSGRVMLDDRSVSLTATEYNLLALFLRNPDRIFSRSAILDRLWGFDNAPSDRAIITHIKDLRKKLKASGLTEDIIETVYGMGYRLKPLVKTSNFDSRFSEINEGCNQQISVKQQILTSELLAKFRDIFDKRISILEQAKKSILSENLEIELQESARQEAHKLAGSLASFGYPEGSRLARSIEHFLSQRSREDGVPLAPFFPEEIAQFSNLVIALKQTLDRSSTLSTSCSQVSLSNYRVLAIDSDVALTDRLKAESSRWGFQIDIASNLNVAQSHLTHTPPDLILLDLNFPEVEAEGLGGLTLLQEIAKQLPNLPVIVFTRRDSLADRLTVSRLGIRRFLHKPATTEQIFRAIAHVLPTPHTSETKVLIVDDDLDMLALLSGFLTPWGLEVTTLSEPQYFWKILVDTSPDLVLLDLEMPEISGLELCRVVRQDAQWEDLPILVVTAHTDANSLQQAFAAGSDDFITKPVLGPELVTRVLSRIERTRFRQKREPFNQVASGGNG